MTNTEAASPTVVHLKSEKGALQPKNGPQLSDVWKAVQNASGPTIIDLGGQSYGGPVGGLLVAREPGTRSFVSRLMHFDKPGLEIRNGCLNMGERYRLLVSCVGEVVFRDVDIIGGGVAERQLHGDATLVHVSGKGTSATFSSCSIRNTATEMAVHAMLVDGGAVCDLANSQVTHLNTCGIKVAGGVLNATQTTFVGLHTNILALPSPPLRPTSQQAFSTATTATTGSCSSSSIVILDSCSAIANSAAGPVFEASGGGTCLSAVHCKMDGGCMGVLTSKTATVELVECEVMRALEAGIWVSCGRLSASNCTLDQNKVGILAERKAQVELLRCRFELNAAASVLGRGKSCIVRLVDCSVNDHELQQEGGAIVFREDGIADAVSGEDGPTPR